MTNVPLHTTLAACPVAAAAAAAQVCAVKVIYFLLGIVLSFFLSFFPLRVALSQPRL